MNNRVSDKTSLNISLPMIIQVVGFISAMVWGYGQLTTRITFVENESTRNTQIINEMKKMQDDPIPSDVKQDEKLSTIEARLIGIEDDLEYLKRIMYKGE